MLASIQMQYYQSLWSFQRQKYQESKKDPNPLTGVKVEFLPPTPSHVSWRPLSSLLRVRSPQAGLPNLRRTDSNCSDSRRWVRVSFVFLRRCPLFCWAARAVGGSAARGPRPIRGQRFRLLGGLSTLGNPRTTSADLLQTLSLLSYLSQSRVHPPPPGRPTSITTWFLRPPTSVVPLPPPPSESLTYHRSKGLEGEIRKEKPMEHGHRVEILVYRIIYDTDSY